MNEVRSRGRRRSEGEGGDDGRAASEDEGKVEVHGSEEVDEDSHGAGVGRTTSPARERVQRMKVATTAQKVEIPRQYVSFQ